LAENEQPGIDEDLPLSLADLAESADAMLWLDRAGVVRSVNRAATSLFDRDEAAMIGRPFVSLVRRGPSGPATLLDDAADSGRVVRVEATASDGTVRPLEVSLSPLGGRPHKGLLAICRDGSERDRLEAQLRQSQKMEAVGHLAGGIAHDLNNVLTVVRSFSELALDDVPTDSAAFGHITEVLRAAERSTRLTKQLLAFSRRQTAQPRELTFNDVVRNTEAMLRRAAGEAVEFRTRLATDPWPIHVDPGHFEQVLLNLVVNARDAMPSGGVLTIATDNVELDSHHSFVHGVELSPGAYAMLAVTDTGVGMTDEVRARVFEPFFTTKPSEKGTGLGLSTCWGIVEQAGGVIWAYSEVGRGTSFKVYVPRSVQHHGRRHTTGSIPVGRGGHETVLVVEDDSAVRRVIAETLSRNGYRVIVAEHGHEAVHRVAADAVRIDALVTDVVMPKMSGPELAAMLRLDQPDLPVLFLSGYSEQSAAVQGDLDHDVALLEKPFSRARLLARVRELLDARASTD
jgi:PAS domain S-box-containing protein